MQFLLHHLLLATTLLSSPPCNAYSPVSLTTTSTLRGISPENLQNFLGSPANWPKIVASSNSVRSSPEGGRPINLEVPLKVSQEVDELFGLPPLFPLSVSWKCMNAVVPRNDNAGTMEFYSENGVDGVACDCTMRFEIRNCGDSNDDVSSNVKLTMSYQPMSLLAILAIPVLILDNTIALRLLLPSVITSQEQSPLNKFRYLMGSLYGIAGLAHLADCLTSSQLLTAAGSPPFSLLPISGMIYALVWCFAGPVSFAASRIDGGGRLADLGLILYGIVEVYGAYLIRLVAEDGISSVDAAGGFAVSDPFLNAIVVQGIVAAAWVYSSQQKEDNLVV